VHLSQRHAGMYKWKIVELVLTTKELLMLLSSRTHNSK